MRPAAKMGREGWGDRSNTSSSVCTSSMDREEVAGVGELEG